MRLIFQNFKNNPRNLMQRAGYHFERQDPQTREESYGRRLSGGADYPKFHIYVRRQGDELILNLHLDQKKPSYGDYTMHSGEYEDSKILQKEAENIKKIFNN
ncbi:MAG: hypothetical protein A2174_01365 [Candidatus Portnoybacteria bacterium RBG_13_41_18]|uniref:Uncharacterized protein n=1 Tax=Candidatus Portnoybacteria bacterium RBG_13_41_18 TaxID=1801991 RepID=A0A1G2F637_9BACT|nr:MAG: hypothetical protein A2174_01365 [Candidatus Portnoybacteria bacterium RBG_13_41_18]